MSTMEKVIESVETEIANKESQLTRLRNALSELRSGNSHTTIEIAANADPSPSRNGQYEPRIKVQLGQWKGLKPHQAIAAYLKACGNPGVTFEEITKALLADGTVLAKNLQYPLRAVSLSVKNAKDTFRVVDAKHAEDKVVFLN